MLLILIVIAACLVVIASKGGGGGCLGIILVALGLMVIIWFLSMSSWG